MELQRTNKQNTPFNIFIKILIIHLNLNSPNTRLKYLPNNYNELMDIIIKN